MREISIEDVKDLQIDILTSIDEFCNKHKIKYSLSSGTLIGAIRHKGYIPWDDDIDIMMPRRDYDYFINTFNGAFKHLSLMSPEINPDYYAPYANVYDNRTLLLEGSNGHRGMPIGVKIDVFPIDKVSEDNVSYINDMHRVERINHIMYIKRLVNVFSSGWRIVTVMKICILKTLFFFIPYSFLQRKIKEIAVNPRNADSSFVDNVVYNIYYRKCPKFKSSILESYINLPFEGRKFSAVKDYDEVLRKMYGDYMQLPPEDKRVPHHNFEAYWIN